MTRYYELEPEVPGEFGPLVVFEFREGTYPIVRRLHVEFSYGYLGDDLMTMHPIFFVTTALADTLRASVLTGFSLSSDLDVSVDPQLVELDPDWTAPSIEWLQISGAAGVDDFGLTANASLIVSSAALDLLSSHRIGHCEISAVG